MGYYPVRYDSGGYKKAGTAINFKKVIITYKSLYSIIWGIEGLQLHGSKSLKSLKSLFTTI